jgi:hypothetical protein
MVRALNRRVVNSLFLFIVTSFLLVIGLNLCAKIDKNLQRWPFFLNHFRSFEQFRVSKRKFLPDDAQKCGAFRKKVLPLQSNDRLHEHIGTLDRRLDGVLCHLCHTHPVLAEGQNAIPDRVGVDYGDMGIVQPEGHRPDLPRNVHTARAGLDHGH